MPERGNSQFYCEAPERSEPTIEPSTDSPDSDETKVEGEEESDTGGERSQGASPLRVCSDVFERMHRELQEKRGSDVYDRMHRELQERWHAQEAGEGAGAGEGGGAPSRPDSLPLEAPTRPPRTRGGVASGSAVGPTCKREERLLSVPNIKYRAEARRRGGAAPAGSLAGSLMRRFSKYWSRAPLISRSRCRVSRVRSLARYSLLTRVVRRSYDWNGNGLRFLIILVQ